MKNLGQIRTGTGISDSRYCFLCSYHTPIKPAYTTTTQEPGYESVQGSLPSTALSLLDFASHLLLLYRTTGTATWGSACSAPASAPLQLWPCVNTAILSMVLVSLHKNPQRDAQLAPPPACPTPLPIENEGASCVLSPGPALTFLPCVPCCKPAGPPHCIPQLYYSLLDFFTFPLFTPS